MSAPAIWKRPVRALVFAVACAVASGCGEGRDPADAAVEEDASVLLSDGGGPLDAAVPDGSLPPRPSIDVRPGALEFPPTPVGLSRPLSLNLANVAIDVPGTSEDALQLLLPAIEPADGDFLVDFPPYLYPAGGLSPGTATPLNVRFAPRSPGVKTATLKVLSNDPANPVVAVALSGRALASCDYEVLPAKLDFEAVLLGESRELSFVLRNKAADPGEECLVHELSVSSPGAFALVEEVPESVILRGGESRTVAVRFTPDRQGFFRSAVEFSVSSASAPVGKVELSGEGIAGCLLVAPAELDFGEVPVSCTSRTRALTVYNICATPRTLDVLGFAAPTPAFSIVSKPVPGFVLQGGASADIKVRFEPVALGEATAEIALRADGKAPDYRVPMSGRGIELPQQTDSFAIDPLPKVDVLLVIDDSSSMADQQASVQSNVGKLFGNLSSVDFRIAVTTTSVDVAHGGAADGPRPDANGCFVAGAGRPKIITRETPEAQAALLENVAVGTAGNESPMLLRPGLLALSEPNLSGCNAGFLRDDASLAIIVISDSGDVHDEEATSTYVNAFFGIKGPQRPGLLAFSAVVPQPQSTSCSVEAGADADTRVRSVVSATGGRLADVCDASWGSQFFLVTTGFGYRTRFFLSQLPNLENGRELVVKVDGADYPALGNDGVARWTYNASANAIDFEIAGMPPPGSTLSMSYFLACPQ